MPDLAATVGRLRTLRPEYADTYSVRIGVPAEPGWRTMAELGASEIGKWCALALETENPRRLASVAATAVGGTLIHAVLGRVTAALVLEQRAWEVSATNLAVHCDGEQTAVRDAGLFVLLGDPAAGGANAEVLPDLGALLDRVAAAAVATLAPLLDAVRAATRYGAVPLWNAAADSVRSAAAYVPIYTGTDRRAARELGDALVDALVAHGARARGRGGRQPVVWREEPYDLPVRAACCLYYKTEPQVDRPADRYCLTCPFLDPADRVARFGVFVDGLCAPTSAAP